MNSRTSAALVDISPVSLGHSLVVPVAHVTSTDALTSIEFLDVWALAEQARCRISSKCAEQPVILLEHGLSSNYEGPSCVRHAHIHVCPIDPRLRTWPDLEKVLCENLLHVKAATSLESAMNAAQSMDSYVVGSLGPWWFTGKPRPKIRQVTRAILCSLSTEPPEDVDWFIGALGKQFDASLRLLDCSAESEETSETLSACSSAFTHPSTICEKE
ncbi:HIT domain-containing protein [Nocardia sp. MH4]|uniref:HIT domain-containing protein n=1 Tax=Nocardia sp. MH4 TaxID=1768677 RepID=UPI0035A87AEF